MAKTRGGKRIGAGRPVELDKAAKHVLYLSAPNWDELKRIGEGNASYAIRSLLDVGQCPECGAQISAADLIKNQEEHGPQNVHK